MTAAGIPVAAKRRRPARPAKPPEPEAPVALDWIRYFAGRLLQMVGLLVLTGAMALFFGAEQMERRMLAAAGVAAAFFVGGWLLSRKRPRGAR